jgi:hypothetical protein
VKGGVFNPRDNNTDLEKGKPAAGARLPVAARNGRAADLPIAVLRGAALKK